MLYFAYGSNMLTRRITERVSSATPIQTAVLAGRRLAWHKRSLDDSGKCDIPAQEGHSVHGVLFDVADDQLPVLDRIEGVGNGYERTTCSVVAGSRSMEAVAYVATSIDPTLVPYQWYKEFVIAGAKEHGLPADYIESLNAAPSKPDPDAERSRSNEALLVASQPAALQLGE